MRTAALIVALVLAGFPVTPAPQTCCYRMPPVAAMHPCCPVTNVRVPAPRATIRITVAAPEAAPRVAPSPRTPVLIAVYDTPPLAHYRAELATIQLRI